MKVWDINDGYDKEIPMFLDVGDWTLLRLHKGFKIPSTLEVTKRVTQHYLGPLQVLEHVGRLPYKLDIPEDWLIGSVFIYGHTNTHWLRHPMEAKGFFIHSTGKQASVRMPIDRIIRRDKQKSVLVGA